MAESQSDKPNGQEAAPLVSEPPNTSVRSSRFKYYIHDGVDACRLQLTGELTAADVPELNGCWLTAKTTLRQRKLILDLRDLKTIDEAGRKWVSSMTREGTACVPTSFSGVPVSQNGLIHPSISSSTGKNTRAPGRIGKLLAFLRMFRVASAESSTQAR